MKPSEIREFDLAALRDKERELKESLQRLRFQIGFGQLKEHHLIRAHRKDIARIKTIIREKQGGKALKAINKG
jgi:large subunit ribosomal protein L29